MMEKKSMIQFVLTIFLIYGVTACMFLFNQRNFIFIPDRSRPDPAHFGAGDMGVISVRTADGLPLQGWYKAPAAGQPVILMFHGNAGHIGIRVFKIRPFLAAGYGVLLAEYRAYGGNPGKPSEEGFYEDARGYLSWLGAQGVPPEKVVLYGESLGTGVSVKMAAEFPGIRGLVLEAPFTSMTDVVRKHVPYMPVSLLLKDRFDSLSRIGDVKTPLLIVHGTADSIVPYALGKALFDHASEPKQMETYAAGGHNDLYRYGVATRILTFLENLK